MEETSHVVTLVQGYTVGDCFGDQELPDTINAPRMYKRRRDSGLRRHGERYGDMSTDVKTFINK